eukprot:6491390-Amphidinium_carterae.1
MSIWRGKAMANLRSALVRVWFGQPAKSRLVCIAETHLHGHGTEKSLSTSLDSRWHRLLLPPRYQHREGNNYLQPATTSELRGCAASFGENADEINSEYKLAIKSFNMCGFSLKACNDLLLLAPGIGHIVCLQETFENPGEELMDIELHDRSRLYCGGKRLHRKAATLLSHDLCSQVIAVEQWSHGITVDIMLPQRKTRIINCHLPNSWHPLHTFAEAVENLRNQCGNWQDDILLAGDMNAELGSLCDDTHIGTMATHGKHEDDIMRAQLLFEILVDYGLVATTTFHGIAGTRPEPPTRYHWALEEQGKTLDYICVRAGATLHATSDVDTAQLTTSDHICVQADLSYMGLSSCSMTSSVSSVRRLPRDWQPSQAFTKLINDTRCENLEQLADAVYEAAKNSDTHCRLLRVSEEERNIMMQIASTIGVARRRAHFRLRRYYRRKREIADQERMKEMLLSNGKGWKFCQFRRSFNIRKQATRLPSQRLRLQDFENYWGDIYAVGLGQQISLKRSLDSFYHTEIERATDFGNVIYPTLDAETLKTIAKRMGNTSGGNDGIPTVVLKHLPDHIWHALAQQFSGHIFTNVFPATWQTISATLIPKLVYASSPHDFRPIAVTDAFERLFDAYLLSELRKLEMDWHTHQFAARRGKQPEEVMALVRNLLHHCFSMGLPLVMVKLDIKKAFDHVSHEALLCMLRARSVPPWLIRTLMALVCGRRLCFRTPAGRTRALAMGRGLIQGKPTSALLFCLLLDWSLKDVIPGWKSRGPATIGTFCSHAIFMDDLLIFGKTVRDVEHMISDIMKALATIGLSISVEKTVWAATPAIELQHLTFGQHAIPRSGTVPFLGCTYCPGNPGQEDLLPRVSKAWG